MKEKQKYFFLFIALIVSSPLFAQTAPATSVVGYPGAGALQAGDLWESILPAGFKPFYGEFGTKDLLGNRQLLRFGNFDRSWSSPGGHYPAAFPWTMYWAKYLHAVEFDPDTTWNRSTMNGKANPSFYSNSKKDNLHPDYSNYAILAYHDSLNGANDPARKYSIEPYFIDSRRQHLVYEAGFPTNLGLDVKVRAHQFQGPNWNNFNDFILVEISFTNTGFLDMNMDGKPDSVDTNGDGKNDALQTKQNIRALALNFAGEVYMSIDTYKSGTRGASSIGGKFTRMGGWINDADPEGNPWAFNTYYAGASVQVPSAGNNDLGFNAPTNKTFTDIWEGWTWIDVKNGALPSDRSQSTTILATKKNIFDVHPVGVGAERGRYVSSGSNGKLALSYSMFTTPKQLHNITVGAFFQDGGRSVSDVNLNLNPNSNFFASGTIEDITTFISKPIATRSTPDGDRKSTNTFEQTPFEDGKADANTNYASGWGKWTSGYTGGHNFDGDMYSGVGPIAIQKDSTVTFVFALAAGYRLEGLQHSIRAARYAYENNFVIPQLPALPDMNLTITPRQTLSIEWDNKAELDPQFAGYKIWKSNQVSRKSWLNEGMRLLDRYQEQMDEHENRDAYKKPINPKFDAFSAIALSSSKGVYQPDTWGTWDLLKTIPKSQLAALPKNSTTNYYQVEDSDVKLGFSVWYYVSAYKEGTFTGPGGDTTNRIETHYTNRNGADGLWKGTYPFATINPNFPKTEAGLKAIGAVKTILSTQAAAGDVANVGVRPNPFKKSALHDNASQPFDHKLLFYNLPPQCKITILDVAGQIIDEINFSDATKGSYFWDMFSKDGIEVASGLYIYLVESSAGKKVGYFSILR